MIRSRLTLFVAQLYRPLVEAHHAYAVERATNQGVAQPVAPAFSLYGIPCLLRPTQVTADAVRVSVGLSSRRGPR